MSKRADFWTIFVCNSMHYFVLSYLCWLKAADTDRAIGKYPIDRTPFLKRRNFITACETEFHALLKYYCHKNFVP